MVELSLHSFPFSLCISLAPKKGVKVAAKKKTDKVANPLFERRPKQFGIGGALPPKKDLTRYIKWPKSIRLQRQKRILKQRLKVPPALNQFTKTLDKNLATSLFKILLKYRPEDKAAKKERLVKKAQAEAEGKPSESKKPIVVKYGLNHVTYLIEQNKAQLVVIAHDVDPIELVVWLPALCRKMEVPYCIVKGKSRLGAVVHQKTAACLCLTTVKNEDKLEFSKVLEAIKANFNDKYEEYRKKWGGGIMGSKSQAKTKAKERMEVSTKDAELELYTIPAHSSWFVWEDIHEIERREFAEFFSESSITRTPKVYKEYRDFIINKYREDSSKRLTFTSIRKYLVGDVNLLRKVFLFLENWGLINYLKRSDDGSMEESEAKVEQGTPAGIRVTATPLSMRSVTVPPLVEERAEPAFKFSPLTSYSDVFTGSKKPLVCGHCGGESSCDSAFYQHTKSIVSLCDKCFKNGDYGENNSPDDFKLIAAASWTEEETLLLLESVLKHGDDWDLIAQSVSTKSRLDCISKLIELPFGEFLMGSSSGRLRSSIPTSEDENLSSPSNLVDQMKADGQEQKETETREEKEEDHVVDEDEPPAKRKRVAMLSDGGDSSLMKQVAAMACKVGPSVATAAAKAAIAALCDEASCPKDTFETTCDFTDFAVDRADGDKGTSDMEEQQEDKEGPQDLPVALRMRASVATALGAAAAHAKILADQEEREMEQLAAIIIDQQLKKMKSKLKFLDHLELIMDAEEQDYIRNSRGVELFICRWIPSSSPKALVFLCHGYGMECSDSMRECGIRLASAGYAVFGMDYEGHGRSMGSRCYIKKFSNIVNDCYNYYTSICAQEEYMEKGRFLYGESMGGAVTLLLHKKDPSFWNGAILVAPMCKISEKVKPHPVVINLLTRVEEMIPKWKIVPTKDVINAAFKDLAKREEVRNNKLIYQDKPRLKTALEMLRTSMNLEDSLHEITMPFFVLHGEADIVTDPEISKALYEKASSRDKTLKLYPGMWHALTSGEPDYNVDLVFADIISWLDHRTADPASLTVTPIRANTTASVERVFVDGVSSGQRRPRRAYFSLLCGLNGGRLVPRSAM
ncbi:unnamed protein product [Brassica rapa subsp. trilocularis]